MGQGLHLGCRATEHTGDLTAISLAYKTAIILWERQAKKARGYCHPSTKCSAPKMGVSLKEKNVIVPTSNSRTVAQSSCLVGEAGFREFWTSPQRKLFYLQQNVKKFKTKGSLKNSESSGERQLGEEGWIYWRYRLNCRVKNLLTGNRDSWEEPSSFKNKSQTLISGTILSKEP